MHKLVTKATYSPEDNKLRLYVVDGDERFDTETYSRLKDHNFNWAPKQRLFVAHWSVGGEDLMVEMAGEILPDDISLVERAEAKAERLLTLSEKREQDVNALRIATERLSASLVNGQPILVGHHSERKMRKLHDKLESANEKLTVLASASNYWHQRAFGVIAHVNRMDNAGVRARRIETLLKDLRSLQRPINHAYKMIGLWTKIDAIADEDKRDAYTRDYAGSYLGSGRSTLPASFNSAWSKLNNGELTTSEVITKTLQHWQAVLSSTSRKRTILHTLNRLAYERSLLGEPLRFSGKLTSTILKTFAIKHGADSPECKQVNGLFTLTSKVPLPIHLADGLELALEDDAWCDLMVQVGYEVPVAAAKKAPILNFEAKAVKVKARGSVRELPQIAMTKEQYAAIYKDYRGVKESECGSFRVKICKDPKSSDWLFSSWVSVFITDSKVHPTPDSDSIKLTSDCEECA
ncbi:DUF3560 domain-containing protein [Vibrio vulnificus]